MAITVTDGVFGARGTSCPATEANALDYSRRVDFSVEAVADNANYALLNVPAGFLAEYVAVEQTDFVADGSKGWTFKLKEAGTQLGGTFVLAASGTLLRQCDPATSASAAGSGSGAAAVAVPGGVFCKEADTLCVCVPDGLTGDKCSKGAFAVHLVGRLVFGGSVDAVASGAGAFAAGQTEAQADANTSGGDPYAG